MTIDDANNALALSLEMNLPDYTNSTIRVETIMGQLYKKNKALYCPLEGGLARSPVLLTQLRKDAIRTLYLEHCRPSAMKSDMELTEFIDAAFDMWTQARYDSILTNMARSVHDCLQHVQNIRTMSGGSILVGAITDGNSNPLVIPHLSNYFDFCVNAEMVGISKPDKRLYLHAVARALEHETLSDMLPKGRNSESAISNDELEELVGPWWVHIGDDFVKDIVAAKNLNMRCIWARELILEKIAEDIAKSAATPQKRKTVEELVQMVSEMKVVEMQIGADDYLVDSLQREFADAIVDEFADVSTILKQWQLEAYNAKNPGDATDEPLPSSRDDPSPAKETALVDDTSISAALSPSDTKFCISCGQKLPTVAKFCSSCGSKQ